MGLCGGNGIFGKGLRRRAPGLTPVEGVGACDDLADALFHTVGHDVDAADAFDLSYLLNQINTQINAFLLLIFGAGEALDDVIGMCTPATFLRIHSAAFRRGEGPDTGQYIGFFQ
jgi:hypothetical protein